MIGLIIFYLCETTLTALPKSSTVVANIPATIWEFSPSVIKFILTASRVSQ